MVGLALLLVQPVMAQQGGVILPPPLQRNHQTPKIEQPTQTQTDRAQTEQTPTDRVSAVAEESRMTVFDDWVHRCTDIEIENNTVTQCELLQAQQRQQGDGMLNVLILAFAEIFEEKEGGNKGFMLTTVVPLDVFLPEGMRFLADGVPVMQVPFRNCNLNGCWSQMIVEEQALNALKKGSAGLARFTIMNGQEVEVKFSLKGLTAGLNALQQE